MFYFFICVIVLRNANTHTMHRFLLQTSIVVQGVGILMAWNMFITAVNYFTQRLANAPSLSYFYLIYIGWAAQIPNCLFNWINVFVVFDNRNLSKRIVCTLAAQLLVFALTIALVFIDVEETLFFGITVASVVILNILNALYANCVFGIAASLNMVNAVVFGSNLCGILVSLVGLISVGQITIDSVIYFSFAIVVIVTNLITINFINNTKPEQIVTSSSPLSSSSSSSINRMDIMCQCKTQLYNVFMIFFVTLSLFPAVMARVQSVNGLTNFTLLATFLLFNSSAALGSFLAFYCALVTSDSLKWFVTLRLLFIPYFLMSNYLPRTLPVWFANDYAYMFMCFLFGFTSGHFSALALKYISKRYTDIESIKMGNMIGAAIRTTGILSGLIVALAMPHIVNIN